MTDDELKIEIQVERKRLEQKGYNMPDALFINNSRYNELVREAIKRGLQ